MTRVTSARIAYFSMEIALDPELPTYCGGLGVLAGDTLKSAADLGLPMVAVTLLYRQGYFRQRIADDGTQVEQPWTWAPERALDREACGDISITLEGREVFLNVWRWTVRGSKQGEVPVYFLDAQHPKNSAEDRAITDQLYGGNQLLRLKQEMILGLGGIAALRALKIGAETYHMNEGHAALLTVGLLAETLTSSGGPSGGEIGGFDASVAAVRDQCVFTTHTPVPAGHDRFPRAMVRDVCGGRVYESLEILGGFAHDHLNMTLLGARNARFVNGVALKHQEVTREMFAKEEGLAAVAVQNVTNGVHVGRWAAPATAELFDRHIPGWRNDSALLRYAKEFPAEDVALAHRRNKARLLETLRSRQVVGSERFDSDALTLGFARRFTAYKRSDLFVSLIPQLEAVAQRVGPIQMIFAGKAHPQDQEGRRMIQNIVQASRRMSPTGSLRFAFLENYDLTLGQIITAGSDVWVNTPIPPLEASGTSGMKAAVNGVPSLSVRDGWWIEGWIEGVTGWSLDIDQGESIDGKLSTVASCYYSRPQAFVEIMKHAVAINGSFFNTERMVREYSQRAYRL